jgi:hypothetical protein
MSKLWSGGGGGHYGTSDAQQQHQAQHQANPNGALGGGSGGVGGNNPTNGNAYGASPPGTLTRNILVHIAGNRATWEHMGMHGALWQINPERAACVFADGQQQQQAASALSASSCAGGPEAAHHEGAILADRLSRAMIRRVTLLESHTNIDEVVAVQIDGLPPREFTKNGEGASVFLTGEGRITQPQELFQLCGNAELGLQWMRQFPRYTSYNLEEVGVVFLTGASYYFVHQEHPVIYFLKANEDQLGIQIFQEPSMEGGWFRIDVDTFVYTVRSLRETVLRNTPSTFNLANLTVRLAKPDAQRWLQLCPQLINNLLSDEVRESNDPELISEARRLGVQRYLDRPLFVTLRLCIEYALPETTAAPPPAPSASQLASMSGGAALVASLGGGAALVASSSNPPNNNPNNNNHGGGGGNNSGAGGPMMMNNSGGGGNNGGGGGYGPGMNGMTMLIGGGPIAAGAGGGRMR